MADLDYNYLAELVLRAQEGDSDSFAELYLATYQQQFRFSYRYLQDEKGNPDLENILDDDEFEAVSDAFDEWLDACEYDEIVGEDEE